MAVPTFSPGIASTSATGLTRFALTAEIKSGVTFFSAMNPGNLKAAQGFISMFESPPQAISDYVNYSFAHGLGAVPKMVTLHAVCVTPELGFAAGDEIPIPCQTWYVGGARYGAFLWADAANVGFQPNSQLVMMNRATPGTSTPVMTYANWRYVIRAWG